MATNTPYRTKLSEGKDPRSTYHTTRRMGSPTPNLKIPAGWREGQRVAVRWKRLGGLGSRRAVMEAQFLHNSDTFTSAQSAVVRGSCAHQRPARCLVHRIRVGFPLKSQPAGVEPWAGSEIIPLHPKLHATTATTTIILQSLWRKSPELVKYAWPVCI